MARPPVAVIAPMALGISILGNRLEQELYVLPHHGVNLSRPFARVLILNLCTAAT